MLSFGKHTGRAVHALAREDGGYMRWLLDKDFPSLVQEICRAALDHHRDADATAFHAWLRSRFGAGDAVGESPVDAAERDQAARG